MREIIARLTWVDYVVFIAVLRGCYVGYRSGFLPELLRIASYLLTVIVTFRFYGSLAQYLTLKTFLNFTTAKGIAFCLLLVGVFFLSKLLILFILRMLKLGEGGIVNKLLGLFMGAGRWVILLSLAFMLIEFSPFSTLKADVQDRSLTGPKISMAAPVLFDYLSRLSPELAVPEAGEQENDSGSDTSSDTG